VKYILLSEKNINLLWKKDFEFDFWLNKLKTENNLELFLSNPRLKEKILDFISNEESIFLKNKIFIKKWNLIIFTDIFLFQLFLSNKNNYNKNDIENNIWFFYEKNIFIFNKENIEDFIYLSYSLLWNQWIKFIQKIRSNWDFTFYTNKKNFKESEKKILNLLKNFSTKEKNLISKNNFLEITEKKSIIKKIINFWKRENNLPNFLYENIFYEKVKTDVKIKNWIWNPVLKIHKFNEKKSLWFWYWWIYWFNDKNNFLNKTSSLESFWYDFYSIKNAKIKSFVEWVERFNSWYFNDDLKYLWKLSEVNLELTKKFIWFDIKDQIENKNIYLKNIFKIESKNRNNKPIDDLKENIKNISKIYPIKIVYLLTELNKNLLEEFVEYVENNLKVRKLTIWTVRNEADYYNDDYSYVIPAKEYIEIIEWFLNKYEWNLNIDIFTEWILYTDSLPFGQKNQLNRFRCVYKDWIMTDCLYDVWTKSFKKFNTDKPIPFPNCTNCPKTELENCLTDKIKLKKIKK